MHHTTPRWKAMQLVKRMALGGGASETGWSGYEWVLSVVAWRVGCCRVVV